MMDSSGELTLSTEKEWACRTLELPVESSSAEQRAQILRRLVDEEFVLSESCCEAIEILADRETEFENFHLEREHELRTQVESFAEEFFQLKPFSRKERWQELVESCEAYPVILIRLKSLKRGLDVEVDFPEYDENEFDDLQRLICDAFVMRREQQIRVCQKHLFEVWYTTPGLAAAAKQLLRDAPEFAALLPAFVDEITHSRQDRRMFSQQVIVARLSNSLFSIPSIPMFAGVVFVGVFFLLMIVHSNSEHRQPRQSYNYQNGIPNIQLSRKQRSQNLANMRALTRSIYFNKLTENESYIGIRHVFLRYPLLLQAVTDERLKENLKEDIHFKKRFGLTDRELSNYTDKELEQLQAAVISTLTLAGTFNPSIIDLEQVNRVPPRQPEPPPLPENLSPEETE